MGLMDKVRAQGTQLAQRAQDTAREGKVKLDQAQAKRRADAMFRDLQRRQIEHEDNGEEAVREESNAARGEEDCGIARRQRDLPHTRPSVKE